MSAVPDAGGLLLAATAAATAVLVGWRPSPATPPGRAGPVAGGGAGPAPRRRTAVAAAVAAAGTAAAVVGGVRAAVWALLATGVVLGARTLLRRRREGRAAARNRERVVGLCELLAGELRAGRAPSVALAAAGEEWPAVDAVRRADALGADTVAAWRALAATPGADALDLVAAAWQISARTGAGLADALARVARLVRGTEATRRVVASELASARATARLMAGLPLVALLVGGTTGGNPVHFLLVTPLGLGCLAAGLAFGAAGLLWIERIADDVLEVR
ncbi:tight adherence protein B [Nocardioides zeae]|uniref:Tight adherence protein B n=2 Tax=Nocardioides zeae TaxID=1457234 RepID=A0ACC6IN36_9ACTN|nr:type II secretion system F family protein [Nocardioides zeae]MDQ1105555.1 tight adherence protein B [Nocardioides zeae]MDR6174767.1 tight adherence protein B [Nocardioides zeae]MDR6212035.1 tight adherence protein B [Nocardioides zeae]